MGISRSKRKLSEPSETKAKIKLGDTSTTKISLQLVRNEIGPEAAVIPNANPDLRKMASVSILGGEVSQKAVNLTNPEHNINTVSTLVNNMSNVRGGPSLQIQDASIRRDNLVKSYKETQIEENQLLEAIDKTLLDQRGKFKTLGHEVIHAIQTDTRQPQVKKQLEEDERNYLDYKARLKKLGVKVDALDDKAIKLYREVVQTLQPGQRPPDLTKAPTLE